MVVSVSPFDSSFDELSVKEDDSSLQKYQIVATGLQKRIIDGVLSGVVELLNPGIVADKASDWNNFLNLVMYRLNIDKLPAQACDAFVDNKYPRRINIYVVDRYNRLSNVVSRYVDFSTATFVFTNSKPVKISNAQPFVSVVINRNIDPAYRTNPFVNITVVDSI